MKKSRWYKAGVYFWMAMNLIYIFGTATLLVVVFRFWFHVGYDAYFNHRCIRVMEISTARGDIKITDPRPIFVCQF